MGHCDSVVCVYGTLWDTVLWNFHSALVAFLPKSGGCGTLAADLPNHNVFWPLEVAARQRLPDINILPESEENSVVSDITKDLQAVSHIFRFQLT